MRLRRALLGPPALQVLRALLAVLLVGGKPGLALVCKDNEMVTKAYRWNDEKCTECGMGKYGSHGKCHECPFFTRQRKYRDVAGTLWCSNSCEQMWENRAAVHDVEFRGIKTISEAKQTVLQYEVLAQPYDGFGNADARTTRNAVCKNCAGPTFVQQISPFRLEWVRQDLLAMNFAEADLKSLDVYHTERFTWSLCRSCPPGFVHGSWFVPEDVRTMSNYGALIPVNSELVIPCKACGVREGVPQLLTGSTAGTLTCQPCLNRMYQLARRETFITHVKLEKPRFVDELTSLVVGASCAHCPAGQQALAAYGADPVAGAFWVGSQCRGSAEQCCSPCPLNQFKEKAEGACVSADAKSVVLAGDNFVPSGGLRQRACGGGERLTYCSDNGCGKTGGWRTCLPCSLDETSFELSGSGCAPCEPAKYQHLVDKSTRNQCAECGSCDELQVVQSEVQLLTTTGFSKAPSEYLVIRKSATCAPLQVRRLEKSNGVLALAGDAHWRQRSKAHGEPLPPHHYLDRTNGTNGTNGCKKAPCSGRCQQSFMYSDGCGNSVTRDKTWVQKTGSNPQRLISVLPAAVTNTAQWTVLSEGNCQFCTPCDAGKFNEGCDKQAQYELGKPEGECKQCKPTCLTGSFLLHPEKEAACHDPPVHLNSTDNLGKFQTLHDYTCERCPTWVKQGQHLSIVAACGLQAAGATYEHYSAVPVNGVLQTTAKPVEPLANGAELLAGVPRKNFRGFMGGLKNYCPLNYFFNPQIPGCAFVNSGSPLAVSARKTVIVGYDAYRPACCQACKNCVGAILKKDMSSWQPCMGDSVEDVQDRCVAKCVLGYWEETVGTGAAAEKRCKRCSSCFDGVV